MNDIKTLLPQREPFLFVDTLLIADSNQIVGRKQYEENFMFCQQLFAGKRIVAGSILVESLIQCGAAGLAQLGLLTGQALWGLASLRNVQWQASVEPPATVVMEVKTIKASERMLRQTGTAVCNDQLVVTAEWCCLRFH